MKKIKILVIRFSSIGDCIWVSPILRCLKTQLNCELHFVTKKNFQVLFANNPHIDILHLLDDKGLAPLIQSFKQEKFDYIIDLHKNLRTWWLKMRLWSVKSYTYPKLILKKWLYVSFKVNKLPKNHVVDRYFEAVKPLGVQSDGKGLELYFSDNEQLNKDFLPLSHRNNFVAFVIGASYYTKRLPTQKIIEFCEHIPLPIVLIGGKEDEKAAQEIEQYFAVKKPAFILNYCAKLSLMQSAWIVSQADYVYGHDTGLMHIAAAFKKKIYAIFGGTTPELGLYPYETPHLIIENKELSCRPCSRLGKKQCPKKHFKCMQELNNMALHQ